MDLDDTICYCFHISKRKIVNFVRVHQPRRASQISECGGAGTGCGWCVNYLKRYFAQTQGTSPDGPLVLDAPPAAGDINTLREPDALSPTDYAQQRAAYIKAGHGKPVAGAIPLPESIEPPAE